MARRVRSRVLVRDNNSLLLGHLALRHTVWVTRLLHHLLRLAAHRLHSLWHLLWSVLLLGIGLRCVLRLLLLLLLHHGLLFGRLANRYTINICHGSRVLLSTAK